MTGDGGAPRIELAGARVRLLPERALLLEAHATLLVADVHLGKAATLRHHGVPIPGGGTADDLRRLDIALARTGARRLVVLGDLFHARVGRDALRTRDALAAWRAAHPGLHVTLVRGNHDRASGDPPASLGVEVVDAPLALAPFLLAHHPAPVPGGYVLAGHLHPVARLAGPARQRLRLPCFHLGRDVGVLPAFGGLTGGAVVRPAPGERIFVVADGEVLPVHAPAPNLPGRRG